jgi:hypothetical protein
MRTKLNRRAKLTPGEKWSRDDEAILLRHLRKDKLTLQEYMELFPDRPNAGVKAKIRRLRIKHDLFGASYRNDKREFTRRIGRAVKPRTVFDAYAGAGHQTFEWLANANRVYAAEKAPSKATLFRKAAIELGFKKLKGDRAEKFWEIFRKASKSIYFYSGDAIDAAAQIRLQKISVDLLDLDTCGSTIPLLPTLLLMVQPKHLVITHGEFHSLRFSRQDVLRRLLGHRSISEVPHEMSQSEFCKELEKAVQAAALRANNETTGSFWLQPKSKTWLSHGRMLRRYYVVSRPPATADCINKISSAS